MLASFNIPSENLRNSDIDVNFVVVSKKKYTPSEFFF